MSHCISYLLFMTENYLSQTMTLKGNKIPLAACSSLNRLKVSLLL